MLSTINSTSSNATAESTLHRCLHPDPAPCEFPVLQRHEESPETACSYWAQDLHSLSFSSIGQAKTPDPFQRTLAHQLLPQQAINSVTHLAELPHCKEQCLALQAIRSPHARCSSSDAPSTNRSKSTQSAQCSKDSLQRKRLTDYQQVLPWQVALTVNLDLQATNSGTSFAEKQAMRTCDTPAHCGPPTIKRSNTTQLKFASAVQNSQTRAVNNVRIETVSTKVTQYRSHYLPEHINNAHSYTEPVWHAMYKFAEHNSGRMLMSWVLDHVEHTLLATPTTLNVGCLAALKTTVTDHLSKMHLHATLKCMSSYLLAFTLLTGQAAKILLMTIWMSPAMFATALQTTRPGTDRRQTRAPWLAQTTPVHCTHALVTARDT